MSTALCSSMLAAFAQSPALAQSANAGQVETVIVTAEKRSENLKDVPASITALSANDLANQQVITTDDLTRAVPGISFAAQSSSAGSAGIGAESLSIRGIGSAQGAATIGLYLNDVPLTQLIQAGTFMPMMSDLSRVEVLRGPQGTLYGASSEGGTVRFITNQPNFDGFAGSVSANLSGTEHGGINTDEVAVLNIPVVDNVLAIRASGEYSYNSGWIDRYANAPGTLLAKTGPALQTGTNLERDYAFHLSAVYQPDSSLTITPSLLYQRQHQNDSPVFFLKEGLFNQSRVVPEPATDSDVIGSLTIDKHFEGVTLTSISSYFVRDFDRQRDGTYFDSDYIIPSYLESAPSTTPAQKAQAHAQLAFLPVTVFDNEQATTFTQEVRLASSADSAADNNLNWVVGLYYNQSLDKDFHNESAPGFNSAFQSIFGYSPNSALSPIAVPGNPNAWQDDYYIYHSRNADSQMAVFGQLDYKILPELRATIGLRYQVSRLTYSYSGNGYFDGGIPDTNKLHTNDTSLTPKFSLTYAVTPDANVYVTAAKGYRDGGQSQPIPAAVCGPFESSVGLASGSQPGAYRPDSLWNYEAGVKTFLADHSISINADVYDIEWSNIQQQIRIPHCGFHFTTNVGSARAYGAETEIKYVPDFLPNLTLGASGSLEHATITSSSPSSPAQVGAHLLFTPEYTATLSASYTHPIGGGLSLLFHVDNLWQGRSHGDFVVTATDYSNRAYSVLNGGITLLNEHGLEFGLFAKNLLNNDTIIRSPSIAGHEDGYTVPPRVVGIQAKQQF